jgi:hypothetical protein
MEGGVFFSILFMKRLLDCSKFCQFLVMREGVEKRSGKTNNEQTYCSYTVFHASIENIRYYIQAYNERACSFICDSKRSSYLVPSFFRTMNFFRTCLFLETLRCRLIPHEGICYSCVLLVLLVQRPPALWTLGQGRTQIVTSSVFYVTVLEF